MPGAKSPVIPYAKLQVFRSKAPGGGYAVMLDVQRAYDRRPGAAFENQSPGDSIGNDAVNFLNQDPEEAQGVLSQSRGHL